MEAAIRQIPNVTHVKIRVNDTSGTVDSIPPHTIAAMVNNGNAGLIAEAIWKKKPPGIGTSGSVSRTVTDEQGNTHTVKFSRPTLLSIFYSIALRSYEGFDQAAVSAAFRSTLFQYTNQTLDIGEAITVPQLYGMLYQAAGEYASTFAITSLEISGSFGSSTEKVTPAWNQKFNLNNSETDVTITVSNQ